MENVHKWSAVSAAVKNAALLSALGSATVALAQVSSGPPAKAADVGISYMAERSLRAGSTQNFWLQGGSAEVGVALWHGVGPAVNFSGATTASIGTSGIPLSLVTATAGPRYRFNTGRWSPYGEVLFGVARGFHSTFPQAGSPSDSASSFALQAGGGLDVRIRNRFFVRAVDIGYVRTHLPNGTDNVQNIFRLGAGVGWRVGRQ